MPRDPSPGTVYLVGAGPGDPGLLTVRGASLLAAADVVLHDLLVDDRILGLCRPGAQVVPVGRRAGDPAPDLDALMERAAAAAREGKVVVRLKAGDPFVFGRGGEEADRLRQRGVPFAIVPGVTAGIAAPAYAGIPVTCRGVAQSVTFATAHDLDAGEGELDFRALGAASTLVLYMGLRTLPAAARALVAAGRAADTPAAVIERGTRPTQRVVTGTLADIAERAAAAGLQPPALVVVGKVAALRDRLRWYETGPLFGRRVVVARTMGSPAQLSDALESLGAEPVEVMAAEVQEPLDPERLDAALRELGRYDLVLFQSALAAERVMTRLTALGLDARALAGRKVAALGAATAAALSSRGIVPDLGRESRWRAEGLMRELEPMARGARVLVPRGEGEARAGLVRALVALGARVEIAQAYRLAPGPTASEAVARAALAGAWAAAFPSSAAARHFCALVGGTPGAALSGLVIAAMGGETARTLEELGVRVDVVPRRSGSDELAAALAARAAPRAT